MRRAKSSRGRLRRSAARLGGLNIPEDIEIKHRPQDIAERKLPRHWEGDFIKGAFNRSAVGALVGRETRFIVLCKMIDDTAESALESFTRQMTKLPAFMRESLAYDRGGEVARHADFAKALKMTIPFADPRAPWLQGSNENANGLLRQFLPKGTELSSVSRTQLDYSAKLLNGGPRKT